MFELQRFVLGKDIVCERAPGTNMVAWQDLESLLLSLLLLPLCPTPPHPVRVPAAGPMEGSLWATLTHRCRRWAPGSPEAHHIFPPVSHSLKQLLRVKYKDKRCFNNYWKSSGLIPSPPNSLSSLLFGDFGFSEGLVSLGSGSSQHVPTPCQQWPICCPMRSA